MYSFKLVDMVGKEIVMKRRAFTLVELLVVISIIALLLAILMPSLGKARKQAQGVVCQTNLKQWGLAFRMYAQDYNGRLFPGFTSSANDTCSDWWYSKLWKYAKSEGIRFCPLARKYNPGTRPYAIGSTFEAWGPYEFTENETLTGKFAYSSYGMNSWVCNPPNGVNPYGYDSRNFWRNMDVKGASSVPLILDAAFYGAYPDVKDRPLQNPSAYAYADSATIRTFCIDRHNGTVNGIFLDLSSKKVGLKELWKLKWHRNFDTNVYPRKWPDWMTKFK